MKGKSRVKRVEYLCDCGAINTIPLQKRLHGSNPAFFYCCDCGKASYDICKKCNNRTSSESRHRFCQSCGAGHESIQVGTEVIDIVRNFWEFFFGVPFVILINGIMYYAVTYIAKIHLRWLPYSLISIGGLALLIGHLCPIYTLMTGERRAPLPLRALSRYGFPFSTDDVNLARDIVKFRRQMTARCRWLVRTFSQIKRVVSDSS
jgi:hypothetical protein